MKKAMIFLAKGFEETEAVTVIDLLRRADIDVKIVSITDNYMVKGAHEIKLECDDIIRNIKGSHEDIIILPGGMPGATNLLECEKLNNLINVFYNADKYLAAICAAPILFAKLNIIDNKEVTSYPSFEKQFTNSKYSNKKVIVSDNIITSRSLGTAIDFSLKIIEILKGENIANEIKEKILY